MRWYEDQRPGLGVEFLGAVGAALVRVGATPEEFATWSNNRRFRRALVSRFPYALFFQIVDDEAVVVAVAHTSRRPGYWIDRTPKRKEAP